MQKLIIFLLFAFLSLGFESYATSLETNTETSIDRGGRHKVKKHRLKKFIMGKRYCDCPKH